MPTLDLPSSTTRGRPAPAAPPRSRDDPSTARRCLTGETVGCMTPSPPTVTVRDLRNHGGKVLDEVLRGHAVLVTRDGEPVAELRPAPRRGPSARELVARRRHLPHVDPTTLRDDLDAVVDMSW